MSGSIAPITSKHSSVFQTIFQGEFQQISFTGSAQSSATFQTGVSVIVLFATADCWIQLGPAPTATRSPPRSFLLRDGMYVSRGVKEGWKLSVISASTDGELDIHEGSPE
jgi:hypothetical protein